MTLRLTQLAILHSQKPEKFLVPDIVCCGVLSGSGRRLSLSLAQYIIHGPHRKQVPRQPVHLTTRIAAATCSDSPRSLDKTRFLLFISFDIRHF